MVRRSILALSLAVALCGTVPVAKADTPLDIFGVEKSINDLARRAQETGDYIAQAFADKALKVIAEWKKANADLIDKGFDRLDEQTKQMFREMNATAERLQRGEAVTFVDMQHVMATAGQVLSRPVGGNRDPSVGFVWPTIALPSGESEITIHAVGTYIADADPKVTLNGAPFAVKKLSDNEISFDVKRNSLAKKEREKAKTVFSLAYRVSMSHWYDPFSWGRSEKRTRDIEVTMLPEIPGTLSVTPHLAVDTWETKVEGPLPSGGHGKDHLDGYPWNLTPVDKEQGWILDKEAQETAHFDDNNGDGEGGSSCVGYDTNSFTDTSFTFLVQHGHKTGFMSKSDANQNCRIWVHLKRKRHEEKDEKQPDRALDWRRDVDVPLPANAITSLVQVALYTGESYTIWTDQQIPYGLWEVFRDKDMIKLRPRPQRDF